MKEKKKIAPTAFGISNCAIGTAGIAGAMILSGLVIKDMIDGNEIQVGRLVIEGVAITTLANLGINMFNGGYKMLTTN